VSPRTARIAGRRAGRGARGLTLIELLIAAALLAVLAVLSWRGLDAVLASRRQIVASSDELRALMVAFSQLDEDLRRSWPVRLLKLQTPSIGFTVSGEQAVATLEMLRESGAATEATQLQRVAWRLRDGRIERGFGAWSAVPGAGGAAGAAPPPGFGAGSGPAGGGQAGGGQVGGGQVGAEVGAGGLIWQPVLVGVASLQMQGWVAGQGWIAAESLAGQLRGGMDAAAGGTGTPPTPATAIPRVTGLLVRVVRTDGRVMQRILPVTD
jgi:prepilin-type N-terminal cleavage/methylation domain-containing protein